MLLEVMTKKSSNSQTHNTVSTYLVHGLFKLNSIELFFLISQLSVRFQGISLKKISFLHYNLIFPPEKC